MAQPSSEGFCLFYSRLESHKRQCGRMIQRALTDEAKSKCEANLHQMKKNQELSRYDHTTPENYQRDMALTSYEVIDYNERQCLRDYAILNLRSSPGNACSLG
jgi:hypothetical protein